MVNHSLLEVFRSLGLMPAPPTRREPTDDVVPRTAVRGGPAIAGSSSRSVPGAPASEPRHEERDGRGATGT